MGTTGHKTFVPDDLVDGGEVTLVIEHEGGGLTVGGAASNLVIDFGGAGVGNICTVSAILTGLEAGARMGEVMTDNVTFKITGAPTYS